MEILIVVVIVAILGGVSAPFYFKAVEKGRQAEAISLLNDMRQAQLRYYYDTDALAEDVADLALYWDDPENLEYFSTDGEGFHSDNAEDQGIASIIRNDNAYSATTPYRMWIYLNGEIDKTEDAP